MLNDLCTWLCSGTSMPLLTISLSHPPYDIIMVEWCRDLKQKNSLNKKAAIQAIHIIQQHKIHIAQYSILYIKSGWPFSDYNFSGKEITVVAQALVSPLINTHHVQLLRLSDKMTHTLRYLRYTLKEVSGRSCDLINLIYRGQIRLCWVRGRERRARSNVRLVCVTLHWSIRNWQ